MSRARDNADLGDSYGSLGAGVTGGSGLTALGTVTAGDISHANIVYPAGHVLQVQSTSHTSTTQLTSSGALSELSSSLRIPFTPLSENSKLYFDFFAPFCFRNSINEQWAQFYDYTNSAVVNLPPASSSRNRAHWANRTSANDVNDFDYLYMSTHVTNSNKTVRTYTIYHGTQGATAEFLVSTLDGPSGFISPMFFKITEVQL
jgi:hypothetical protein